MDEDEKDNEKGWTLKVFMNTQGVYKDGWILREEFLREEVLFLSSEGSCGRKWMPWSWMKASLYRQMGSVAPVELSCFHCWIVLPFPVALLLLLWTFIKLSEICRILFEFLSSCAGKIWYCLNFCPFVPTKFLDGVWALGLGFFVRPTSSSGLTGFCLGQQWAGPFGFWCQWGNQYFFSPLGFWATWARIIFSAWWVEGRHNSRLHYHLGLDLQFSLQILHWCGWNLPFVRMK